MILKLIHSNKIGAYAFMLLLIILFWVKPILEGSAGITINEDAMPLWHLFSFANGKSWLAYSFSIVCAIIIALNVTRFNSKYGLLSKQSALPGLTYVLLVGGTPAAHSFSPLWIATILMVISLEYLFIAHHKRKPMKECFLAAFWLSLSSLFFYKALLFIPLLIFLMLALRVVTFRSFLATSIGIILPWLLTFGYYFTIGHTDEFIQHLSFSVEKIAHFTRLQTPEIAYLISIAFIFLIALFSVINAYGTKKIFTRKQYQIFVFCGIYISLVMLVTGINMDYFPILAFPYAIIISHLIDHIRSWVWQNIFVVLLFAIAISGQIFL
ncbi:hypothetical protein E9993_16340 [Labilibacter sediminis]|nr:hypothetical protein E9993_16340 [Labilibacter sediminis]